MWLIAFLLAIALAQPVNIALAVDSEIDQNSSEEISTDVNTNSEAVTEPTTSSPTDSSNSFGADSTETMLADPTAMSDFTPHGFVLSNRFTFGTVAAGDCVSAASRSNISDHNGTASDPFIIADYDDLVCMQELVNNNVTFTVDAAPYTYRTDKYWQFGSFDANSETFSPIGTNKSPFSGYLVGDTSGGGLASVSGLTISGTNSVGLLGAAEDTVSIENLELKDVTVSGTSRVGAWVGSAGGDVELTDVSVTGEIWATGAYVGGVVGRTDGVVTAEDVSVSGDIWNTGNYVGCLVGYTGGAATFEKVTVDGTVSGTHDVGGLVGLAVGNVTVTDVSVSGTVSGTGLGAGGLVGYAGTGNGAVTFERVTVDGAVEGTGSVGGLVGTVYKELTVTDVSVSGTFSGTGTRVGGLVGYAGGAATFEKVTVDGIVSGSTILGGLLGSGGSTMISQATVRLNVDVDSASFIGGLMGALSSAIPSASLRVDNSLVTGTISGKSHLGGLVGVLNSSTSATITSVVTAVELSAQTNTVAGLINTTQDSNVDLKSVLNLARVVSSATADGINQSAALVYGTVSLTNVTADKAYHWQGLSASAATYHPFTSGTVTGTPWKFNGDAVNCSEFSRSDFWTATDSMGLTDPSWNFDSIVDGYLPSLNGQFNDVPFSCMNTFATDDDTSATITPWNGTETLPTIPVVDNSLSWVQYFTPASLQPLAAQAVAFNDQVPYQVWFNGTSVASFQFGTHTYDLATVTPTSDNTISLGIVSFCDSQFPNISGHTGESTDPFEITSADELACMSELVNNLASISSGGVYRTGKYWQLSSFNANSETFSPIGTLDSPFSGYLVGDGPVSVSELTISGLDSVGLLGVTEGTVSLKDLELKDVTVSGANSVGAWVGSAGGIVALTDVSVTGAIWATGDYVGGVVGSAASAVTAEDISVSGDIWATGNHVGGVVGRAGGAAQLTNVSVWGGIWATGDTVGGILGSTVSIAAFTNAVFDGTVSGSATLGGLLGAGADTVNITEAAVRLNVEVTGNNPASYIGGLIGTLSSANTSASLQVDNSMVTGTISGQSHIGGLLGALNGNVSATISSVVTAVELSAQTEAVAGLINTLSDSKVDLKSVLNLARVVSSATADGYAQAAALVLSSATPALIASQAYHWQGLSASASTYHPFASGTVSDTPWKFNGEAVNCSEFSQSDFWTKTDSMGLTDPTWNFDAISDGYLPSLNGQFADVPFSCINTFATDDDTSATIAPWNGTETLPTIPVVGTSLSRVQYFTPASSQPLVAQAVATNNQVYYEVWFNGTSTAADQFGTHTYDLATVTPTSDNTISLTTISHCNTQFPNISGNTGESTDPFEITSADELACMLELVSNSASISSGGVYRTGHYWQFSSFSASSVTLSPIGTVDSPFSGYLLGDTSGGGPASITDLTVSGANSVGLLGVTEGTVSIKDLELKDVTVSGISSVGAWVGSAGGTVALTDVSVTGDIWATGDMVGGAVGSVAGAVTAEDVSVSGDIWSTGDTVGGVVGRASGAAQLTNVSVWGGIWATGDTVGGILGSTASGAAFTNAVFDGTVSGSGTLGGLLGAGADTVNITQAAVRVTIDEPDSASASNLGGLIGALSSTNASASLRVDNSMVTGAISGQSYLGGLIGVLNGEQGSNISATITSMVTAVQLSAQTEAVAGLINTLSASEVDLTSVVNLARVVSSATADGYNQAAALVSSSATPTLTHSQAYRWLGLSASAATYHPFTSGTDTVSGSLWKFNGDELNCAVFSESSFWSDTGSMNLQVSSGWNFDAIADGYLPSLNGQFADATFSCMNTFATDNEDLGIVAPWSGSATETTLPYHDRTNSRVRYFAPSESLPLSVHTLPVDNQMYYSLWYNGDMSEAGQLGVNNYTLAGTAPLSDNTISLSFIESHCDDVVPTFSEQSGSAADDAFQIDSYLDLVCMQNLVNGSTSSMDYRTGKYWQFSSFSAGGSTLGLIGTAASPFSGYIIGNGDAIVEDITISGTDSVGLLGVTEGTVSLKDLELKDVTVSGANSVGAWVGSAGGIVALTDVSVTGAIWATGNVVGGAVGSAVGAVTAEDVSVSGDIWATGDTVGGVVGRAVGAAQLTNVSVWGGIWATGDTVGGILGSSASGAAFSNAVFDGTVSGSATLGGLLGAGADTVNITEAAVRLNVDVTGDNPASYIGGLIGTLSSANPSASLRVDNSLVTGTISGKSHLGGLVGALNGEQSSNISATITSVVTAAELFAQTEAVAGLINTLSASEVDLKSVLNLARGVSSATADGYAQAAALVLSSATPALIASQAYHWQGLSASASTYHPFASGTVSDTPWKFNGEAVNCSEFSQSDFWTKTDSMGLTDPTWNFDAISDGYLPSLNGQFADVPFSCMNEITYPEDWSSVTVSSDFGYSILPIVGGTGSAHYFIPAETSTGSLVYRFNVGNYAPFDIYYNGTLAKSGATNDEEWSLTDSALFAESTISLNSTVSPHSPEFQFNLSKSNTNLLLSWLTQYAESVSISFTTLTNFAGGTPPGISRSKFTYSGGATTYTWNLGAPPAGTYVISVNGSILGIGQKDSQTVAATQTWTNYLTVVTKEASISFPDVFTGSAKTVTYKNNGKVTVSRVSAVNASRYAAIRWLASVAVTAGSQSDKSNVTTFRAQDAVNRGAMAQLLQKLAGFTDAQIAAQYQGKPNKFTDTTSLQKSNPARYYAILWLADTGITAGCNTAGTKFCPANTVNRGAMAEFMRKFAGVTATSASTSPFPDVNLTAKNVKYDGSSKTTRVGAVNAARMGAINWMSTAGITAGSGSSGGVTTYRPQDPVNRGAMAEFMRKLAQKVGSTK